MRRSANKTLIGAFVAGGAAPAASEEAVAPEVGRHYVGALR